jgi:tRNA nucleotidyltransferase (CCA-adding enzyme)
MISDAVLKKYNILRQKKTEISIDEYTNATTLIKQFQELAAKYNTSLDNIYITSYPSTWMSGDADLTINVAYNKTEEELTKEIEAVKHTISLKNKREFAEYQRLQKKFEKTGRK